MARITRQVLSFGLVGVVNTLIDFVILNVLVSVVGLPRIPSNVISSSIAMVFSFFANKRVVFDSKLKGHTREILLFFAVTVFGLYVLQTGVIYLLAEASDVPGDAAYRIVEFMHLDGVFSREFTVTNFAKLVATVISMIWNYFMYRDVVFAQSKKTDNEEA